MRLISYTKSCIEQADTPADLIAYCARVSNPSNQELNEGCERLIKYLIKHKHWSPLEMVDVTIEIEPTRDIGRQILRHWSFTFQEFSQRYASVADMNDMFELSECRMQDTKNRQNSLKCNDSELEKWWLDTQQKVIDLTRQKYLEALEKGIAKELARKVLPEGLTKTRMYMKGSIRDWIHYLELRSGEETQKEHRLIAVNIAKVILDIFPINTGVLHERIASSIESVWSSY